MHSLLATSQDIAISMFPPTPLRGPVERGLGNEKNVDGFQGTILCFWVEQVDHHNPDKIEAGEEEVGSILKRGKYAWVGQRCRSDSDCPTSDSKSVSLSAHFGGKDFRGY